MKTISISNQKGGIGKSTIAVNLAIELSKDHRVLIIDNDISSKSTLYFFSMREPSINITWAEGTLKTLRELKRHKEDYDYVILDNGGFNDDVGIFSMMIADLVIVPTSLEDIDLVGLAGFSEIMLELKEKLDKQGKSFKVACLPNKVYPRMSDKNYSSKLKVIHDLGYETMSRVEARVAYSKSYSLGQAVTESIFRDAHLVNTMRTLRAEVLELLR